MNEEFNRINQKQVSGAMPVSSMADFDEEAYRPYLDGLDVTDEQASELMHVVWNIMRMWVEMDLPADTCGQIIGRVIIPPTSESDSLP